MRSAAALLTVLLALACGEAPGQVTLAEREAAETFERFGGRDYRSGYTPRNEDGTVNVVVEIPTGTHEKWEVSKEDGLLRLVPRNGKPRIVHYLAYPGNYGMVPATLGGDGDPLDAIILAPALRRGSVARARLIGVLELLDKGEADDKLLAVVEGTPLGKVDDLEELDRKFPGVSDIVHTWFSNYKGGKMIQIKGFGDRERAEAILDSAVAAYAHGAGTD